MSSVFVLLKDSIINENKLLFTRDIIGIFGKSIPSPLLPNINHCVVLDICAIMI